MRIKGLFLSLLFILIGFKAGYGQEQERFERGRGRITYESLVHRSHVPQVYFDYSVLPKDKSDKNQLLVSFKIEYDYLMFKRNTAGDVNNYDKKPKFKASAGVTLEVFKADRSLEKKKNRERRRIEQKNLDEMLPKTESVARGFWNGTAVAQTYEITQSNKNYLEGYISVDLKPGNYDFILQLKQPDVDNERQSRIIPVHVPDFKNDKRSYILMLSQVKKMDIPSRVPLLNFGHNVYYGKDFNILFLLPKDTTASDYEVSVSELNVDRNDTTEGKSLFSQKLNPDHIYRGLNITPSKDTVQVTLNLKEDKTPYDYGFMRIPNSEFPNSIYRLMVRDTKTNKVIARRMFQSRWINMPTSLLNLNVAIEMMKYIVSKSELKELDSGSFNQKEKKFRAYWKKRDPTPKTEYNELMAEYYRRIDYAYEHFTSMTTPGYNQDRGKIYIMMGPPESIERKFPTNQPALIIWKYPNGKKYVFQATTGFGDFVLVK